MEEIDLLDIAEMLFKKNPDNCSPIRLQFDQCSLEELHNSLLQIFTSGMKHFYGDHNGVVNLKKLSNDDFNFINKFFNIIGFSVHFKIYPEDDYDLMITNNFTFDQFISLDHYRFKLKSEKVIYVIYFSILNQNI